jgi:hypothetical protein
MITKTIKDPPLNYALLKLSKLCQLLRCTFKEAMAYFLLNDEETYNLLDEWANENLPEDVWEGV